MQKRGIVSEVLPKDALHDFVTFTPGASETQAALYAATGGEEADLAKARNASGLCYTEQEKLAPGLVAVVTPVRPDNARAWLEFHLVDGEFPKKVLYAIPKETVKELQSLQSIRLECTSYIPAQELATNAKVEVLQGIKAIQAFRIHVRHDDEAMEDAIVAHTYLPGKAAKKELALFLGDKPIFQLTYQEGRGELATAAPQYIPPDLPESYQQAVETLTQYVKDRPCIQNYSDYTNASQKGALDNFPTVEESQQNFPKLREYQYKIQGDKPEKTPRITDAWRTAATAYYTTYPLADPTVDTPKKAILGTISEMAKDGYTEARIKSVLTNLDNKCREEAAVSILNSTEGKQAIRQARKARDTAETIQKTANTTR